MEVHQLRYFVAIADEGSFTAAAARLHVSQSGVSTQLAKLEHELGQRLLTRGRMLTLTPAGHSILPLARETLASLEAITYTAAEFADAVRGPAHLGMIPGCTIPGLLDVVAHLRTTHPGITLHVSEGSATDLQDGIRERRLDIALTGYAGTLPPEFAHNLVTDEQLHVFAPQSLGLGARPSVADIQQHPVLCLPVGSGIRAAYDQSCVKLGIAPRVDIEASSPLTLLGLAERGGGVAVLPPSTEVSGALVSKPLRDAAIHAKLALISRHEQSAPAVRLVTEKLTAALSPS
ncbi:LysR family transcriptional regulator [Brevibacterium sp. CS2]|uniref:LysR family transcriptional regulator n=1 Tax=Brevibacterium sp. CS2 TaxID=2575923 RepID=UPI0010C77F6E|nr:LysR family transcriptional regulator [Brevibacterium sp. CS2]QCP04497.1 LysR family transcriptional regulator [Brevibacterium sp. CS2]